MEHVTPRDPTGPRSEGPNVAPPFYSSVFPRFQIRKEEILIRELVFCRVTKTEM